MKEEIVNQDHGWSLMQQSDGMMVEGGRICDVQFFGVIVALSLEYYLS